MRFALDDYGEKRNTCFDLTFSWANLMPALDKQLPTFWARLPEPNQNNVWYEFNDAETVIVFVHGIFSDSRNAWLFEHASKSPLNQYWPELVLQDENLGRPSIFLGGFHTAFDSGKYDAKDASRELFAALSRTEKFSDKQTVASSVLEKRKIIFVCHSTGGIVVRYMLYHNREAFHDKFIGIALIASPSYGSETADTLSLLSGFYSHRLGQQLMWDNPFLEQLDQNFKDLLTRHLIPNLVGIEAVEHHFIVHRKWLPDKKVLVDPLSGSRYFGSAVRLRETNHFTTVKPDTKDHPAHQLLRDFVSRDFRDLVGSKSQEKIGDLMQKIKELRGTYLSVDIYGAHAEGELLTKAPNLATEILGVRDDEINLGHQIAKYEYACYAYVLAASVESSNPLRGTFVNKALSSGRKALDLIAEAVALTERADPEGKKILGWIIAEEDKERVEYFLAIAYSIDAKLGGRSTVEEVRRILNSINPQYLWKYPPEKNLFLAWALSTKGGSTHET